MKTSQHLTTLDLMRGFAAVTVVLYHLAHYLVLPRLATNGNLAVDFFFCLSGYVLARSYGDAATLGFADFARIRLIRLMPMIVLATLLSGVFVLCRLLAKGESGFAALALACALGMTSLPYFDAPASIGGPQVFPLNGPQYTLLLELVVNAVWFAGRRFDRLANVAPVALGCFTLLALFGWGGDTAATFAIGFPRVGASFFLGVALFLACRDGRAPWLASASRLLFAPAVAAMVALFFVPIVVPDATVLVWAAVISPILVLGGANLRLPDPAHRLGKRIGDLSYPVYTLHYPVFCWLNSIFRTAHWSRAAVEVPLTVVVVIAVSAAALHAFDRPARIWLGGLMGRARVKGGARPAAA